MAQLQANALDDHTGGFDEVWAKLRFWVIGGAVISGVRMMVTDGASASHLARETFYSGVFGLATGLRRGFRPILGPAQ